MLELTPKKSAPKREEETIAIGGEEYPLYEPTRNETLTLMDSAQDPRLAIGATWKFLAKVLHEDALKVVKDAVENNTLDLMEDVLPLAFEIVGVFSETDPTSPSDSSDSRKSSGSRSTASSQRRASTRSSSRSAG